MAPQTLTTSMEELRKVGVRTISDMAACDLDALPKVKGASADTLKRAKRQAAALINRWEMGGEKGVQRQCLG